MIERVIANNFHKQKTGIERFTVTVFCMLYSVVSIVHRI